MQEGDTERADISKMQVISIHRTNSKEKKNEKTLGSYKIGAKSLQLLLLIHKIYSILYQLALL